MIDWLKILWAGLQAFLQLLRMKQSADDRQAGRDEANASTRAQGDERVREAMEAEIEGNKSHEAMPGDEAFDTTFRRD